MSEVNKGGRPPHEPTPTTRAHVERMAAVGLPEVQIAQVIGITAPTLRLHYRSELDGGLARATYAVANNLYRQATKDSPRAFPFIKFWLNCRAGWSEYSPTPVAAPEPLGKKAQADLDAKTADEGTEWAEIMQRRDHGLPN